MTADRYAELEVALHPIRAEHPGITCAEAAPLLPAHLRAQLWARVVERYLFPVDQLADLTEEPTR